MCTHDSSGGPGPRIDRRRFVLLAAGSALALHQTLRGDRAGADDSPADAGPAPSDRLVALADPQGKTPLRADDVRIDAAPLMALPLDPSTGTVRDGTRLNRILLLRVDPKALDGAVRERSADGVLGFSAVCTHEACFVNGWLPAEGALVCPCHSSKFDARAGGEVLNGPASRALPMIPLKLVGGELAIAGPFSSAPGVKRKSE